MKKKLFFLIPFMFVASFAFSQENKMEDVHPTELTSEDETFKYALPESDDAEIPKAPARGGCTMIVENTTTLSMYVYLNGVFYGRIPPGQSYNVTPARRSGNFYARSASGRRYFDRPYNACEYGIRLIGRYR